MKTLFSFILCDKRACFYERAVQGWQHILLQGERSNYIHRTGDIDELLRQLNTYINHSAQLKTVDLVILYSEESVSLLSKLPEQLAQLGCTTWQILRWETLLQRASTMQAPSDIQHAYEDDTWLKNILLPFLDNTLSYQDETWLAERKRAQLAHEQAFEETLDSLRAERTTLEMKIVELEQKMKNIQLYNIEQLLIFLPVLYRNFWSKMKPSDLALLAGTYQIPDIPSPYPEPDGHTIIVLKQRLQSLPEENIKQLKHFCSQLPSYYSSDIRPEMRFFFHE